MSNSAFREFYFDNVRLALKGAERALIARANGDDSLMDYAAICLSYGLPHGPIAAIKYWAKAHLYTVSFTDDRAVCHLLIEEVLALRVITYFDHAAVSVDSSRDEDSKLRVRLSEQEDVSFSQLLSDLPDGAPRSILPYDLQNFSKGQKGSKRWAALRRALTTYSRGRPGAAARALGFHLLDATFAGDAFLAYDHIHNAIKAPQEANNVARIGESAGGVIAPVAAHSEPKGGGSHRLSLRIPQYRS